MFENMPNNEDLIDWYNGAEWRCDINRLARCTIELPCHKSTGYINNSHELTTNYGCLAEYKPGKFADFIGGRFSPRELRSLPIGLVHSLAMAFNI